MAPEPVALVPLAAANALPVASVVEVTATKGEASQPPLVDPPHPDSEDDDLDSDDDYDSEDEEQNHLINGALLGLEMLPPGAEVRQRIGTSKLGIKKTSWSKEEDKILTEIVTKNGAARWSHVASHLPGRAGKQCRERWFNHLCPEVKKGSWSAEEDRIIMESVARYGTRWSKIVKLMPGRTDNAIKNRYNSAMRKVKRLEKIKGDHEPTMTYAAGVIVAPGPANSGVPAVASALPPRPMPMPLLPKQPQEMASAGKRKRDDTILASPAAAESNLPTIIAVATVASPNEVLPPLANATVGADVAGASPLNPKGGKPAASPKSKPGQGTPKKSPAAPKPTASPKPKSGNKDDGDEKSAKKPRSGGGKKASKGKAMMELGGGKELAEHLKIHGLSPPTGLSPGQLANLLATQEGGLGEFSALESMLLSNSSPPGGAFSAAFAGPPATGDELGGMPTDGIDGDARMMGDGHFSPSAQITMLLEEEGIKGPADTSPMIPEASPFDFSGAMGLDRTSLTPSGATPPSNTMPPPPPPVSMSSAGRVRKPSSKVKENESAWEPEKPQHLSKKSPTKIEVNAVAAAAATTSMPPPPAVDKAAAAAAVAATNVGPDGQKRLSDGAILELFEQLDPESQRKQLEAAASEAADLDRRNSVVPAPSAAPPLEAPTPNSLGNVNVTLANEHGSQGSGNKEGRSPMEQLSPLHLSDFLTAL